MSTAHLYGHLNPTAAGVPTTVLDESGDEKEAHLQSFERGYQAGWDDAIQAQKSDAEKVAAELSQSLQDLNFTHVEASASLLAGMSPVLHQIIEAFLPDLARAALAPALATEIDALLRQAADKAVHLTVSPTTVPLLDPILKKAAPLSFEVTPDPDLTVGQAFVRAGGQEREVNMDAMLESVQTAMRAFVDQCQKDQTHE